ncbi:hypothetical protein [Natrinema caseinilyticum]|uniref:hypothetical protein n=1 Tax=Natrinema caseinilyticum TaxID=2961570 RepID=UPI0020C58780|nr:hypothetical protein [Natrinema caseinilyticum]
MPTGTGWELTKLVVWGGDRDRRHPIVFGGRTTSFDAPGGTSSVRIVGSDRETGRERPRSDGVLPVAGGRDSPRLMTDGGTVTDVADGRADDLETEIARAERALESLEADTGDLIRALTTVRETISALEARGATVVTEIDSVTDRVEELEDGQIEPAELDRLRADVTTLETSLAEAPTEADLESIEDRLSNVAMRDYVDAQLDALTSVIEDVDTAVGELEAAIEEGRDGTADVDQATVDAIETTVEGLETDVESLSNEFESLQADLVERESWEATVDDELAEVKERLEPRGESIETATSPSRDDRESVTEDVESLTDGLESVTKDVESLTDGLESIRETTIDEADLEAATAELADADRLREVEEAVPMIAMTVENLERDVSARLERLDEYDGWATDEAFDALEDRVQTRFDEVHTELSSLDAALDAVEETVFELERSVESTDETVRAVQADHREETVAIREDFETLRERIGAFETRISEFPEETADPDQVEGLAESVTDLRRRVETLERETVTSEMVTAIQTNLAQTRRHVDTVEGTAERLEPTVSDLHGDVDANHQQLEAVSATLESVETAIESDSDLEADIEDVESNVDEIEGRLDGINGKIESDLKTLHLEVSDLRERVETDERSVLERMVKDDVFGLVTVAFVAISAIGASMAFFDGQHVFTAVFAAVPIVTVLGAHLLAQRS